MIILYNLGMGIYYTLALIVSVFNKKARLWIKGRRGIIQKLKSSMDPDSEYAWFHVSSLGEFEQGRPLMESLKQEYPNIKIVLTFFSPSGYEIRKNYEGADLILYLPLDTSYNARKFIKILNPKWTFFVKYEYWYNFLKHLNKSGSKLYLISGIFRKKQLFFKWYGGWYRKMLTWFDHLFVQNAESVEMLKLIGINNYTIAGDSRFDRVIQIAQKSKEIDIVKRFSEGSKVIVAGSTWEHDEDMLIEYINNSSDKVKLVVAPHEIHPAHLKQITEKISVEYQFFSKSEKLDLKTCRILIIDNFGLLSSIYKYAMVTYIGGGFGAGIHNTLEAAVYGVPILFGPNYHKFQEAHDLLENGAAFTFENYGQFEKVLTGLLTNFDRQKASGESAKEYVDKMKGATKLILEYLKK